MVGMLLAWYGATDLFEKSRFWGIFGVWDPVYFLT
jgi:hypothetical protein